MSDKQNIQSEDEVFEKINYAETKDETDKKCPQCGGVMDYNPSTGGLKCPYCDYEEEIKKSESAPEKAKELDFLSAEKTANKNWGVETKTVICEACGAESVYDSLQTAAVCPFCGSNQVMETHDKETIAPGGVVPFKISDKEASNLFQGWIKKKWFCPKLAKDSARPKRFQGIYLPYWTFDTDTYSEYTGDYGIDHVTRDSDGNSHVHTNWHYTSGSHHEFINDELVLASSNHDASMLHKLEPFDTENNKTYKPEYIAGFVAERYSLGLKEAWKHAMKQIKEKLRENITNKILHRHNADHVRNVQVQTDFKNITYKYLLLPIWISSFKYKDKIYQFMINGQTGKVAGKTPLSVPKVTITVLGIIALIILFIYLNS